MWLGTGTENEIYKIQLLMKQASVTVQARKVVSAANVRAEATGAPAAAIELSDGTIVTGKTSDLLGASAALILNALKVLAGLDADMHLISPDALDPIRTLKVKYLGGHNPRLHTDEVLIALSSSASKRTPTRCWPWNSCPSCGAAPGTHLRAAVQGGHQHLQKTGCKPDQRTEIRKKEIITLIA